MALSLPALRPRSIFPFLVALCLASGHPIDGAPVGAATWQAGTGREKITPTDALWMTGYATRDHPAEGTSQELWVKALAVSDPAGHRGVLLTLDL